MFILFLPGSFRHSSEYPWLSGCLSSIGDYYTIDYPISSSVAKLNSEHYAQDALLKVRRELIYGSQSVPDSKLTISYDDSICGSFLAQVRQRHGGSDSNEQILSETLLVGHSQGAGHAAVLAMDTSVRGALMIAGPADAYQQMPSAWTSVTPVTPRSRFKMFIHAEDRHARMCLYHSAMLGLKAISILADTTTLEDVLPSQVVIDTRLWPPLKSHDCLTIDSAQLDSFNKAYLEKTVHQFQAGMDYHEQELSLITPSMR